MSGSNEATFKINIEGNASVASKDVAASARLAAKSIAEYENETKVLSAELRRLRGNSDEVVATKTALKKRIDEAKTSASSLTIELAKQGTTYAAAAAAAKKYGDGVGKLPNLRKGAAKAFAAAGGAIGPAAEKAGKAVAPITKKLGAMFGPIAKSVGGKLAPAGRAIAKFGSGAKGAISSLGKAAKEDLGSVLPSIGSALGVIGTGAALAGAAVLAVGVAFVAGAAALAAFGIAAADSAAKMSRQREALLGSASDAKALGNQISELAGKVPQGVEELNALSVELSKTRLTGKAIVDTMAAVAQATGAVDTSAGSKIKELLTRNQASGRFFLGQLELQGTGLDFDDVAKAYAEGTKKSIGAARKELMNGEAPIEAGAEALRRATEKKFGALNLKNAFSLENGPKKLKEQLATLSSGVDLSPISKGLEDVFGQLSPNAPLGAAVKSFMETFGGGLVDIAGKSIPVLLEGFKWLVVGAVGMAAQFYETKKAIKDAFVAKDWVEVAKQVVIGLIKGIEGGRSAVWKAIVNLATGTQDAFKKEQEIHSPSKKWDRYGENTTEGYARGVDRGARRANSAVQNMVQEPALSAAPASSGGVGSVVVNIHGAPVGSAQAMQSPEFLAMLTRAIRDAVSAKAVMSPAKAVTG